MAHSTQITGGISEMTAAIALMANGWEVAFPSLSEVYDLVAKDPQTDEWRTCQVKTIRRRTDRNNESVIYATNGKGEPYQPQDCDLLVGVEGGSVYLVPCTGLKEYWCADSALERKWTKLELNPTKAEAV
jgi:hypothetical protein